MAKMFYTLDEAAQRLGVSEDEIKRLAGSGKLQQFRDRDKLMYKRDQIDAMATEVGTTGLAHVVDEDDDLMPKEDEGDQIDLAQAQRPNKERKEDPRERTGISVFDADEVESVDPMAQTQVSMPTAGDEEELALESVGSGSGLLDLTRESDDTSLGAELLEEIYPGSGEGSDSKLEPVPGSSTGLSSGGLQSITPESGASGLENLQPSSGTAAVASAAIDVSPSVVMPMSFGASEQLDAAGSGFGAGALMGACITLIVALVIAIAAIQDVPASITAAFRGNLWLWTGGLFALTAVLAVVGLFIGKAVERRA